MTYQLQTTDIVKNDEIATSAAAYGQSLSANNDEGDGWDGMPDLDHKSQNVQNIVKAYEKFLVQDLGYTGFRYDMVKGFAGSHIADYNAAAGVKFSVGEYWDGNATAVQNWINTTKQNDTPMSAAFDFPFRYTVRDAINNNNWSLLGNTSLAANASYKQYAVTFVENHDTEYRSATSQQDPIRKDTLAANAFMLAMPGTPCVFYKHYAAYPSEIKAMIDARKAAGLTNTSSYTAISNSLLSYSIQTTGTKGKLVCSVGNSIVDPGTGYTKVLQGTHFAYFLDNALEMPFVDKPSGTYEDAFQATLTAVSATAGAQLVYTTDGTTPTASSTKVSSGAKVNITASCTLSVGLLVGGVVKNVIQREYTFEAFQPKTIKVYVNADNAGSAWNGWTTSINYHSWGGNAAGTAWPGTKVSTYETIAGKQWSVNSYTLTSKDDLRNFVFDLGTGTPQTVDVNGVNEDAFFEINSTKSGNNYNVVDVTSSYTGIALPTTTETKADNRWYTLQGVQVSSPTRKGVYIHNGKKIILR